MRSAEPDAVGLMCEVPSAPLVVHVGEVVVATDALLAHGPELAHLADAIEADAHRLGILGVESRPGTVRSLLEACERRTMELADEVRRLRANVLSAEAGYALAERAATRFQDIVANWLASVGARAALAVLPAFALTGWVSWHLAPGSDEQKAAAVQRWLLDHPELITSPEFSTLVRHIVTGADDAVLGAMGVPAPIALVLGEHGLGLLGVGTSAATIIGLGTLSGTRVMNETPVRVERVATLENAVRPVGAADRLERVPDDAHVRIERYAAPGEDDRFVVYLAPTHTFSPTAGSEPWDLTSNVAGVAGLSAGSIRATEQAMADAGITAESEVVFVGYSQGGLIADAIAGSGDWNVVGLETYGDPGGGIELPEGIRGVAVRHSDDFVVATGGPQEPNDRVIVERRAFAEGAPIPSDEPVPAHQRGAYEASARMLDGARSSAVRDELDALDAFTREYAEREGGRVTSYSYRAERISASS